MPRIALPADCCRFAGPVGVGMAAGMGVAVGQGARPWSLGSREVFVFEIGAIPFTPAVR